jgi:outer membrane immunogenic protein
VRLASLPAGRGLLASATLATLASTAALSADLAIAPVTSWSGLYAGINGAGVWGDAEVNIPLYPANFDLDTDGFGAGGFAGFNVQINRLVVGIEGDGTWMDVDGNAPTGGLGGAERYNVDQDWEGSVRGRIGVAFDNIGFADSIQVFGTGGGAFTELQTSYTPALGGTDNATYVGWTAGGGVELMKGPVVARAMYRFSDYGEEGFFHAGPSSVDYQTHMIYGGLGIKFNSLFGR